MQGWVIYPVGNQYRACFEAWVNELRDDLLFGPDDPLFPKPRIEVVEGIGFQATGLSTDGYANALFIRKLVKEAFVNAGLFPFIPHSFRKTLATPTLPPLWDHTCKSPSTAKAN